MSSDDDLPSLQDIFSRAKSVKKIQIETELDEKENFVVKKNFKVESVPICADQNSLKVNVGVFVKDHYNGKYVPGVVIEIPDSDSIDIYSVKLYDGRVENLGRRFILCPDDSEFYSVKVIPIESVVTSKKSLIRKLNRNLMKSMVESKKQDLIAILEGSIFSGRHELFIANSHSRMSLNIENPPGPFSIEEHKFLMEYLADHFVPELIRTNAELREKIEVRFEKTGKALDHLLRQYSYTVLVPEFVARRILDLDASIQTISGAFEKLYNDFHSFDLETGNFIYYLYSKQDMYRYARRERP